MRNIQVIGALVGAAALYVAVQRYRKFGSKKDLLIGLAVAIAGIALAAAPTLADVLATALSLDNPLFAILTVAVVFLLGFIFFLHGIQRRTEQTLKRLIRSQALAMLPKRGASPPPGRVDIIIPAYNEEGSIGGVLDALPKQVLGLEVVPIVISDGSTDRTEIVAREHGARVIALPINQGQGAALRTGIELCDRDRTTIFVTMDADGQHDPADLATLVGPIARGEAEFVVGSRWLGRVTYSNAERTAGIHFFSAVLTLLLRRRISDCTNGFRAISGEGLRKMVLKEDRFNAPEMLIEAKRRGLRLQEVPVTIHDRTAGASRKPRMGYAFGLLRTTVTAWLR